MSRTRIKICGLTRVQDVQAAAAAGADALGFIFAGGPRSLTPQQARDLAAAAPPWLNRVGVFGPDQRQEAPAIAEACRLDTLQLVGEVEPAYCAYFRGRFTIIATVGVPVAEGNGAGSDVSKLIDAIAALAPHVDGILLDATKVGMLGGTGQTFDWGLIERLHTPVPLIIAGGLNPENIGELVSRVHPFGVDVSSGVESAPGVKAEDRLKAFVAAIHATHP